MRYSTQDVLGQAVKIGSLQSINDEIIESAELRRPNYVCFTTAYMMVKALHDGAIRAAYDASTMVLPDGQPIAWCLHALGHTEAECISGPRLTPMLLRDAALRGIRVGFYGGRPETLRRMEANLRRDLPALQIAFVYSPPFRTLSEEEGRTILTEVNAAGVQMMFVGLGSPKQDLWMRKNAPFIPGVSLGIGAAFEFLSGEKYLPPSWVQQMGLTWLIRLWQEPRRLLRRNLYSPVFVFLFLQQYVWRSRFERSVRTDMGMGDADE